MCACAMQCERQRAKAAKCQKDISCNSATHLLSREIHKVSIEPRESGGEHRVWMGIGMLPGLPIPLQLMHPFGNICRMHQYPSQRCGGLNTHLGMWLLSSFAISALNWCIFCFLEHTFLLFFFSHKLVDQHGALYLLLLPVGSLFLMTNRWITCLHRWSGIGGSFC